MTVIIRTAQMKMMKPQVRMDNIDFKFKKYPPSPIRVYLRSSAVKINFFLHEDRY